MATKSLKSTEFQTNVASQNGDEHGSSIQDLGPSPRSNRRSMLS